MAPVQSRGAARAEAAGSPPLPHRKPRSDPGTPVREGTSGLGRDIPPARSAAATRRHPRPSSRQGHRRPGQEGAGGCPHVVVTPA